MPINLPTDANQHAQSLSENVELPSPTAGQAVTRLQGDGNVAAPSGTNTASVAEDNVNLELVELRAEPLLLPCIGLNAPIADNIGPEVGEELVELRREVAKKIRAASEEKSWP